MPCSYALGTRNVDADGHPGRIAEHMAGFGRDLGDRRGRGEPIPSTGWALVEAVEIAA